MRGFISKISGKFYLYKTDAGFEKELLDNGLTLEDYCEKYMTNVAQEHHRRTLKNGELYKFKNIRMEQGTYEKVIVQEKFTCKLCGFSAIRYESFISHLSKMHHIGIDQYLTSLGYSDETPFKKCALCDNECYWNRIEWDDETKTFVKMYDGEVCKTEDCINRTCLKYFGKPYSEAKYEYEGIGGRTDYLCEIYHTTPDGLKKLGHSKAAKNPNRTITCSLISYIERYGVEEGTKKYKERCAKISRSLKLEWFVERYGEVVGKEKYRERMASAMSKYNHINKQSTSKGQLDLYNNLLREGYDWELNYGTINGVVDMYEKTTNTVVEFYGDFWHCNPRSFSESTIHPLIKLSAKDIWKKNEERMNNIMKELNCNSVIVWEHSWNTQDKT